jgi:tetratricopeptide (TPR) repeat protein
MPRGWNPDPQVSALRQELLAALEPLHDAAAIFEAAPAPEIQQVGKAKGYCDKMVFDAEAKSLELAPTDMRSLSWARMLAAAWTCAGWADIETKELGAAEIYLRPAWRLSQNPISGYQLARALEAEGKKAEAAHMYELASVAETDNMLVDALPAGEDLKGRIAAGYKRVSGKELTATSLNHGQYDGSLHAELDKEQEIHQLLRATKLTGSALYVAAFESGKPATVTLLGGDKGFESLAPALQAHVFGPMLPNGSKARLLREVRIICSPWSGCDAYLLRLSEIASVPIKVTPIYVQKPAATKSGLVDVQPE